MKKCVLIEDVRVCSRCSRLIKSGEECFVRLRSPRKYVCRECMDKMVINV